MYIILLYIYYIVSKNLLIVAYKISHNLYLTIFPGYRVLEGYTESYRGVGGQYPKQFRKQKRITHNANYYAQKVIKMRNYAISAVRCLWNNENGLFHNCSINCSIKKVLILLYFLSLWNNGTIKQGLIFSKTPQKTIGKKLFQLFHRGGEWG